MYKERHKLHLTEHGQPFGLRYHLDVKSLDGSAMTPICFGDECWRGKDPWYPKDHHFDSPEQVTAARNEYRQLLERFAAAARRHL